MMNQYQTYIFRLCLIVTFALSLVSCNKFLDRQPKTMVTPPDYFTSVDQLEAYIINAYNGNLRNSRGQTLYHAYNWDPGITVNDIHTDNYIKGQSVSQDYFANNKQVPSGQVLGWYAGGIRYWNYFFERTLKSHEDGKIIGDPAEIKHCIGEAYFFRAMMYFRALVSLGDYPIVTEVLEDNAEQLKKESERKPRNEVARFILSDLDKAIAMLKDRGYQNNLRINKQAALLFKSRVALFEGTFEKYHRGTGRVPGDERWPGKSMAYNQGKTFNIDAEIAFFLSEAMNAAQLVADNVPLTPNSKVYKPQGIGDLSGWNRYFDMFSQVDLSGYDEVLLWKQYNLGEGVVHDAAYLLSVGGNNSGINKGFVDAFLMENGLPIYASGSAYQGDVDPVKEMQGRDGRLQLFVGNPSTVLVVDPKNPVMKGRDDVIRIEKLRLKPTATENRDVTGYRPFKFNSYDYNQQVSNQVICYTACPIFRAVEAYLNYIEASYEKNGSIDATAAKYWKAIRERAGVDTDFNKTIQATDVAREAHIDGSFIVGDLGAYSGPSFVDATLYNIRRERRCEFISEGFRWDDLKRWRSWDALLQGRYQMQGFNLWAQEYKKYIEDGENILIPKPGAPAIMSSKEVSTYIRPLQINKTNNPLYDGMSWKKAYYLEPIGVEDLTINQLNGDDPSSTTVYQNPYWPTTVGKALE